MTENPQENLHLLLDACRMLSTKLELSELLTEIMQMASHVVGAETASLFLLDEERQELYFHVALGLDPSVAKIRLKVGQGIAGSVAADLKPLLIDDVRADKRWTPLVDQRSGFQTRSILAAPMSIKGRLLGVVEAVNRADGRFTDKHLRVFEAFASQAAIAIDNARLFASLREEKAKLDAVYSQMRDAAVLTDAEGRILLSNASAHRFFDSGGPTRRTINEEMADFTVAPPLLRVLVSPAELIQFEASRDRPKRLVLAGTAASMDLGATEAGTPGERGRLFIFRDVTEERQEEMLKRTFLSLISHKLKTPLAAITGYAEILLDEIPNRFSPEAAAKHVDTILSQGRKLTELVDKLLRFTTLEELGTADLPRESFAVDQAVLDALAALGLWLKEQGAAVAFAPRCGATLLGARTLIREAVKNLVENAVKFDTAAAKKVSVSTAVQDGQVTVTVADHGPGIPPEEIDRIFSKFYQVEPSFTGQVEGWGLGLAFVRKSIEAHGGRMTLKSRLGEGTTATFTLPLPRGGA